MSNQVVIVALPIGDKTFTYADGDVVPIHQTLIYLGTQDNIERHEASKISAFVEMLASDTGPITAKVSGKATLGEDRERVVLTESVELTELRRYLADNELISKVMSRVQQYPNWVSHVAGLQNLTYGDFLVFNRLAFWDGESYMTFPFRRPTMFALDD